MPKPELFSVDFDERPFTVAWELTRACALACLHCRASAVHQRNPLELTTEEAFAVIDRLAVLAPPVLVLTGGDPLMRRDLFDIVTYAVGKGLRVSVSPTATALTTRARLSRLKDLGIAMIHVSLDGATEETHDSFRGFAGTFRRSMTTLETLKDLGMAVQIGTTVCNRNVHELPEIARLLESYGVRMWNLFFLVPTGRGVGLEMVSPEVAEGVWRWLAELAERAPYSVRTTAAPQFRRAMFARARVKSNAQMRLTGAGYDLREAPGGVQTRGVNDGKGFMFIDHLGNICPSGFLQLPAGNVRGDDLVEVYRHSSLFTELRDPALLRGRCGQCSLSDLCGGSRARAYAVHGSYLEDDPLCTVNITELQALLPGRDPAGGGGSRSPGTPAAGRIPAGAARHDPGGALTPS